MSLGSKIKGVVGKFVNFFRNNAHKATSLISTAQALAPMGITAFTEIREALSNGGPDQNQEAPRALVDKVNLIIQAVNKLLVGIGNTTQVAKYGSTYSELATKYDSIQSAMSVWNANWKKTFIAPLIELSCRVPPDLNETRSAWISRAAADPANLEFVRMLRESIDAYSKIVLEQGEAETEIPQVPSIEWVRDEPHSSDAIALSASVAALDSVCVALESLDPQAAPGYLNDVPVDQARKIDFPASRFTYEKRVNGAVALGNMCNQLTIIPPAGILEFNFTSSIYSVISNGGDYYLSFDTGTVLASDLSIYTVDETGANAGDAHNRFGVPIVAAATVAGTFDTILLKLKINDVGDQYGFSVRFASAAGCNLEIREAVVISVPSESSTTVASLVNIRSDGTFAKMQTDTVWGENFFSYASHITADPDFSLSGYVNGLVLQSEWDLALRLVRANAKRLPACLPSDFNAITGLTRDIAGFDTFLRHFEKHGMAGLLISHNSQLDLAPPVPAGIVALTETHKLAVYNLLRALIVNTLFTLRSEVPKQNYKNIIRSLGVC
jgi:hypothetical protein